jgi:UDP-N-acetylmuramoyl-L-alanyl-D-glutamate--2,6-diaminopimelate ligase
MINFKKLLEALPEGSFQFNGNLEQEISSITWDFKKVKPGALYFCVEDEEFQESHIISNAFNYWADAVQAGAIGLLTQKNKITRCPDGVSVIAVDDVNVAMAFLSRQFYDNPLKGMQIVGITGTNGKTTTSQLLDSVFLNAGRLTGIIGTIGTFLPSGKQSASHLSNPMASDLFEIGKIMQHDNVDSLIMEVTSHSMAFNRNAAIDFDIAVFTNLSQDHLDYHLTLENYKNEKLKHFAGLGAFDKKAYGIINFDDVTGVDFLKAIDKKRISSGKVDVLTYGIRNKDADLVAYPKQMTGGFSTFDVFLKGNHLSEIYLPMPGLFNIYNSMAAFASAFALGIGIDQITEGLKNARQVDGRFEKVDCPSEFGVYVDYAHTPDALKKILEEIKTITRKKTIVVFGCGGDRDRTKRAEMGKIAADIADSYIVTADNPRTENPDRINRDIVSGIPEDKSTNLIVETDRKKAIYMALEMASPGDSVLIAGKGHETYQIIGDQVHSFSDRIEAQSFFLSQHSKFSRAWLTINTNHIKHNYRLIFKDKPDHLKVLSVVKDNGLGHGILKSADAAREAGCDYLAVACMSEALTLRQNGFPKMPILIFGERTDTGIPLCVQHNLTIQIQSFEKANTIAKYATDLNKVCKVHIKVDTGLGRYGIPWEETLNEIKKISNLKGIEIEGLMTHFAQSGEKLKDYANLQLERFQSVVDQLKAENILPPIVHCCNSGGYLDLPEAHFDMVRLGSLPIGVYPTKDCRRIEIEGEDLKPSLTATSIISFIKQVKAGESVGYGKHFTAKTPVKVAILPVGYGDGYPRLRNQGYVLIGGKKAPIIGGITLDTMMINISELPEAKIGDEVILIGQQGEETITAEKLAEWAGTVTHDILCRWGERMDRVSI